MLLAQTKPIPTDALTGVPNLVGLETVFSNVVSVILGLAGVVFFVLLLISGLRFITSGGDPKALEGARKTLTFAIGGFIAVLLSYLILVLIGQLTSIDLVTFKIVQP